METHSSCSPTPPSTCSSPFPPAGPLLSLQAEPQASCVSRTPELRPPGTKPPASPPHSNSFAFWKKGHLGENRSRGWWRRGPCGVGWPEQNSPDDGKRAHTNTFVCCFLFCSLRHCSLTAAWRAPGGTGGAPPTQMGHWSTRTRRGCWSWEVRVPDCCWGDFELSFPPF